MTTHPKSADRKSPSAKAPAGGKDQKTNGRKQIKKKTVAAEIGETVMREEPAPRKAAAVPRPVLPQRPIPPSATAAEVKAAAEPPKRAVEDAVDSMEKSFQTAGQSALAVNRKLFDFARANMTAGFDLAKSLADAKSPMQVMHLHMAYWNERLRALVSQSRELRDLSAELMAKTNESIRAQMRRS